RTRLHALWTLDGIDAIDAAVVARGLEDSSPKVRAAAVRLSERWLGGANHPLQAAVLRRLQDPDWMVRGQLAASLGALPVDARVVAVTSLLEQYGDDAVTMDAAISGLAGIEALVLEKMMLPPSVPTTGGQPARETPQPETPQRETPQRETPQRETP